MCPEGTELVVFVTEPCGAQAFPPDFRYHRDGRLILRFGFEALGRRVGDNPDHPSPELLAANLMGPDSYCPHADDFDHDGRQHRSDDRERLMKVLVEHFALPSPPLAVEVTAR